MDVTIEERSASLFTEYDISAPDRDLYAKKEVFNLFNKIVLEAGGRTIATLQGKFSVLRDRYEFHLAGGGVYFFECIDRWKGVYDCHSSANKLTLYRHKGLNHSIFKDDQQIAAYSKNRLTLGKGNKYAIRMDADADLIPIVSMVLALSVSDDNDDQTTVNYDFGSLGPEAKEFDSSWEPK